MILLVKSVIFPTTLLEKLEIPFAIEAANSPPGRFGNPRLPELLGAEVFTLGPDVVVVL